MKRLFLFAAFFDKGVVGEGFLHYVKSLSSSGDVVVVADSDVLDGCTADSKLDECGKFALFVNAKRHGEYDFGSYKRCWQWSKENLEIAAYDIVYMVNDSVFGPLVDITPCLERMESSGYDAVCMAAFPHKKNPHMQSWFMGVRKNIFMTSWFDEFLMSVRAVADKNTVCTMYETGFSKQLKAHGVEYFSLLQAPHKSIYNAPLRLYRIGLPFIKKNSFVRHNGCLGHQIGVILNDIAPEVRNSILDEAEKVWGREYMYALMNQSRTDAIISYLKYLSTKILEK